MAEFLYATSHITGTVDTPDNANGNTPSTWAGVVNSNTNATSRWAMGNTVDPLISAATQTIRVVARKGSNSNDPTVALNLYENGSLVAALVSATTITSTTGQTLTGTFNTADITNADDVEIEVVIVGAGGSGSARNSAQISHIEWEALTGTPPTPPADYMILDQTGSGQGVSFGDVTFLDGGTQATWLLWYRPEASWANSSTHANIMRKDGAWSPLQRNSTANRVRANLWTPSIGFILPGSEWDHSNEWVFAAVVVDRSLGSERGKMYLAKENDVVITKAATAALNDTFTFVNSSNPLMIGIHENESSERFAGNIAQMAVFSSPLTESQLNAIRADFDEVYNHGSLIMAVPFAANANDTSGNGHNGTLVGSPTFTGDSGTPITPDPDTVAVIITETIELEKQLELADSVVVNMVDTISIDKQIGLSETAAVAIDDQIELEKQIPLTETAAVIIDDQISILQTVPKTPEDDVVVAISDSVALEKQFELSDDVVVAIDDAIELEKQIPLSDSVVVAITDEIDLEKQFSASDGVVVAISDTIELEKQLPLADTVAVVIDDQISIAAVVPIVGEDDVTVVISEAIELEKQLELTESAVVNVVDSIAIEKQIPLSDSIVVTISDSIALEKQIALSDTLAVVVDDQISVDAGGDTEIPASDTVVVAITDEIALEKQIALSDTVAVAISEDISVIKPVYIETWPTNGTFEATGQDLEYVIYDDGAPTDVLNGELVMTGTTDVFIGFKPAVQIVSQDQSVVISSAETFGAEGNFGINLRADTAGGVYGYWLWIYTDGTVDLGVGNDVILTESAAFPAEMGLFAVGDQVWGYVGETQIGPITDSTFTSGEMSLEGNKFTIGGYTWRESSLQDVGASDSIIVDIDDQIAIERRFSLSDSIVVAISDSIDVEVTAGIRGAVVVISDSHNGAVAYDGSPSGSNTVNSQSTSGAVSNKGIAGGVT